MKAIVLTKQEKTGNPSWATLPGTGIENLTLQDIPVPVIKDNEVLVQVKAVSINPVDAFVRGNSTAAAAVMHLKGDEDHVIIGWDISGIVTETGKSVTRFKKGDEVFGMVNFE